MLRIFLSVFGICFLSFQYAFSADNNPVNFLHLDKPISQNTGVCIIQDHKGFLWIGTTNGLNRYDGTQVVIYENIPGDSSSISDNYIRKIVEDKNGDLWVATENGLNRYDRAHDRFIRYYLQPENVHSLASNNISDVFMDRAGRIWVAATDLCLYQPQTNDFQRFSAGTYTAGSGIDPYHNFIYQNRAGNILYGYWRKLYQLNTDKMELEIFLDGTRQNLGDNGWHFHEIIEDTAGYYWLASNKAGLLTFSSADSIARPQRFRDSIGNNEFFSDYRILSLYMDRKGFIWVSCENAGLVVLDKDRRIRHRFVNIPADQNSISGNSIWSICEDNQNRMWFGIWNAGINYIDPYNVSFMNFNNSKGAHPVSNNIITDFLEDKKGNLWIATDGGGLNYFNRKTQTFTSYVHDPADPASISSNAVLCLCFDDRGRLWAGTWNGGINILDASRNKFLHLNPENSGLNSNDVFDLLYDEAAQIFVATYRGGLNIYNLQTAQWENYLQQAGDTNSLSGNNIFMLYQDMRHNIWIGTLTDGLNLFQKTPQGRVQFSRYMYYPERIEGISDNRVHSIYEDIQDRLWIGTSNGLNLMDREKGTFKKYKTENGLPANYISAITGDNEGALWLSSLKGITRFDSTLSRSQHYDMTDNLQGYHFNKNAVYKTRSGELLFGGSTGFNLFHPGNIKYNPHPPPLVFTDLKISNQSVAISNNGILQKQISETDHITLSYKHAVFSIEFVALNFTYPEKNEYAYKMEGFEDDWIYSGSQRNATYTNLDAGDYLFRVKAANNDGVWNEKGIELKITITPPFWKTWWAYTLYVLIIVAAFYMFMRYRLSRIRLQHDLELEHLKLEKLSEIDKIKSRFFTNVSHEIRTPIMLIVGPLENLLKSDKVSEKIKSKLQLIIRNAQRLSRLLSQLIDFYRIESPDLNLNLTKNDIVTFVHNIFLSFKEYASSHQIRFSFSTNLKYGYTWFDGDKLDKIIYNLLSNAFKFTADKGIVELELSYHTNDAKLQAYMEICVRDNGIGIPAEKQERIFERFYQVSGDELPETEGIGIGLHMTREFVELHQGELHVQSVPGKGTTFRVILPLDTIDFEVSTDKYTGKNTLPVGLNDALNNYSDNTEEKGSAALILFVEDDPDVQQYIKDIFANRYKILTANDGLQGFAKAMELVPDLVISDIVMPLMDGYELCLKLKSEQQTSHIPVILLTVQSEAEQKLKGIKFGADAYLPKPFNPEELQARVENLLENRRKLNESFRRQILMEPADARIQSLDEKFILQVKQEVEKHLSDWKLDAEALSREIGISRIQLYRKLKGLTGQTVHEFMRSVRLRRAVQLLEQRKMKVTEIAYHVGFNDLNYFSRCFRKQYGKSPSEYLTERSKSTPPAI